MLWQHHVCQACSSHGEPQIWFSLVSFKVRWINHSITNQQLTLLKVPNLYTTLLRCGINVSGMHYTYFFQQSSLPLWPGHDLLSAFFIYGNISQHLSLQLWSGDIQRVGPLRKHGENWSREMQIFWNWFSLLDLLLRVDAFCLLLPYRVAVHAPAGRLRWNKMHLCSSRDYRSRLIDWTCASNHITMHVRRLASICCHPTWSSTSNQEAQPLPVLHVASSPLLVTAATISSAQKPHDNRQCAGRHRTWTRTMWLG